MKLLIILPLVALFSVSCSSSSHTPEGRITENPEAFAQLSEKQQALVKSGQIENEMSKTAVYLAWGKPSNKAYGQNGSVRTEDWIYSSYRATQPYYGAGAYGAFHGPYRYYGSPYGYGGAGLGVQYVSYPTAKVTFEKEKVASWKRGK